MNGNSGSEGSSVEDGDGEAMDGMMEAVEAMDVMGGDDCVGE